MAWADAITDPQLLKRCIGNLVALSALPAMWRNCNPHEVAEAVTSALVLMLESDFVHFSLPEQTDQPGIDLLTTNPDIAPASVEVIRKALKEAAPGLSVDRAAIANPVGDGMLHIASAPMGFNGHASLTAGSRRPDFPSPIHQLLLRTAANEATVALESWHRETTERRLIALQTEISERARIEAFLREGEARLNALVGSIDEVVFEMDGDGTYLNVWNRNERLIRARPEAFIGHNVAEILGHEHAQQRIAAIRRVLATGEPESFEFALEHQRNSRWFVVRVSPIPLPDGSLRTVACLVRDITERKKAEEAMRETQAELTRVARMNTLGELAASIAHEINQPLGAIVTNAGAGLRWLDADTPALAEVRQTLARIQKDGNRAGNVIGRIRALARKSPMQMIELNVNDVIVDVIGLTRAEIDHRRVALHTQLGEGLPRIVGDRVQLQQVILNLIVNSIEAMHGVQLPELWICSERAGPENVRVSVRDSGPGLDPRSVEHIFESFYTTKADGMGMGLSICRSIIELHGGHLCARANQPTGAVFEFELPCEASVPAEVAPCAPEALPVA